MIASALLELFAVLFGVLLALWVNNRNEERKERGKERGYLASLLEDVSSDCQTLEQLIAYAQGTGDAARTLLGLIRHPGEASPEETTLLRLLKRAGTLYPFRLTTTTFQELAGGGGLAIITDRKLLREVINYYAAIDFPREVSALAIQRIWYDYYEALAGSIDPVVIPRITNDIFALLDQGGGVVTEKEMASAGALPAIGLETQEVRVESLQKQPELERALALVLDASSVVSWSLARLRDNAIALRDSLRRAIATDH